MQQCSACDRVTLAQGHVLGTVGHAFGCLLACAFAGTSLVRDSQLLGLRLFYSTLEVPVKHFILVVPRRAMQGKTTVRHNLLAVGGAHTPVQHSLVQGAWQHPAGRPAPCQLQQALG